MMLLDFCPAVIFFDVGLTLSLTGINKVTHMQMLNKWLIKEVLHLVHVFLVKVAQITDF